MIQGTTPMLRVVALRLVTVLVPFAELQRNLARCSRRL